MAILKLFEHHSFNQGPPSRDQNGAVISLNHSCRSLSRYGFNDILTSYQVQKGYTVEFYLDDNFQNLMWTVPGHRIADNRAIPSTGTLETPYDEAHLELWREWPPISNRKFPEERTYNDQVSSVRIIGPDGVELAEPDS